MSTELSSRNIGLDLVRVTEATALTAGRWLGLGDREGAHRAATEAMAKALNVVEMNGCIVIGEEGRLGHSPLDTGRQVGTGNGPAFDVVVDPIDGTELVVRGHLRAISVLSVAPRGAMLSLKPAVYMDKIVVDREAAAALGISTGNLIDFLQTSPKLWEQANQLRAHFGHKPLRGS